MVNLTFKLSWEMAATKKGQFVVVNVTSAVELFYHTEWLLEKHPLIVVAWFNPEQEKFLWWDCVSVKLDHDRRDARVGSIFRDALANVRPDLLVH